MRLELRALPHSSSHLVFSPSLGACCRFRFLKPKAKFFGSALQPFPGNSKSDHFPLQLCDSTPFIGHFSRQQVRFAWNSLDSECVIAIDSSGSKGNVAGQEAFVVAEAAIWG